MKRAQIDSAVDALLGAIADSSWEEHGIDQDEARTGLLAALLDLRIIDKHQRNLFVRGWKREEARRRRQRDAEEAARRAALTPEEREREDKSRANIQIAFQAQSRALDRIISQRFDSKPLLGILSSLSLIHI